MKAFFEALVLLFLALFAAVMFSFLTAWIVMLLWNWLMPVIFGLGAITFWQAFGLMILSGMLFGGVRYNYNKTDGKDE